MRLSPDVAVIGGAGIRRPGVFDVPRFGTLNLHPGLLPEYRGCSFVCRAILDGAQVGATLHQVDSRIDAGPIIERRPVSVMRGDTLAKLMRRVVDANLDQLTKALTALSRDGRLEATAQSLESGAYYHMASASDRRRAERRVAELAAHADEGPPASLSGCERPGH